MRTSARARRSRRTFRAARSAWRAPASATSKAGARAASARAKRKSRRVQPAAGAAPPLMQQEIREQPASLARTLDGWLDDRAREVALAPGRARALASVRILGCGSAAYAGMVGAYLLEQIARVPAQVELASGIRGRASVLRPDE